MKKDIAKDKDTSIEHDQMPAAKCGRPAVGEAMTPAQRQQASRAKRLSEKFESFPAKQINILLSPQANQALEMLASYRDKSQKALIEELLIHAYAKQRDSVTSHDNERLMPVSENGQLRKLTKDRSKL